MFIALSIRRRLAASSAFAHRFDVDAAGEFVSDTDQSAGEQTAKAASVRNAGTAGSAGGEMKRQPFFRSGPGVDGRCGAAKGRIGYDGLSFAGKDFPEPREAQALVQSQEAPATPRHLVHEHLEDRGSRNDHVRSSAVLLAVGPKRDLEKTFGEMFKALQGCLSPPGLYCWPISNNFQKFSIFFVLRPGGFFNRPQSVVRGSSRT